jgi:iron complex outermembrane receptor protein
MPRVEVVAASESDDAARRRESIAKSIYGREELDRQGDIDLTDVLKRLPGVSMDGGAPRLRGLGGGYTQVLLNGEPAPPGFSLETLAPGDVERIEIIKGSTAEYSGVAGTINVVLREPPKTLQREWRSNVNYRAVQPGGSTSFQWGDRVGDVSFAIPVSIARSAQGTSYDSVRVSRTPLGDVRSQAIDGRDVGRSGSGQIAPRLQWKISESDTFNLGAFVQRAESVSNSQRSIVDLMGSPSVTVRDQSETLTQADVQRLQVQWQRRLPQGARLELKSFRQMTQRESEGDYSGWQLGGNPSLHRQSVTQFQEDRAVVGAKWSQPLGIAHTLLMGWEAEQRKRHELRRVWDNGLEQVDSFNGLPFEARIERSAVFVQDEWSISEQWAVLPGLRMEQVRTRSAGNVAEIDNLARITVPTLHLNYRFDPKGKDQIRANLTRSFKLPDLGALLGRYVFNTTYEREFTNTPIAADRAGNPLLRPELASGLDLAYEHYPAGGGVLSVGIFNRRIDDLIRQDITLETVAGSSALRWVSRPRNVGQASSRGLELEIKGRAEEWFPMAFDPASGVQLRGALSIYESHVDQVDGPDNRLEAQPPWHANMGFDARVRNTGWTWGMSLILQPAYATQQTDRQLTRRSALRTLDAFASWRIDRSMQFRVGLTNILAPDNVTSRAVEDLDGFSASSATRRDTLRTLNAGMVLRF